MRNIFYFILIVHFNSAAAVESLARGKKTFRRVTKRRRRKRSVSEMRVYLHIEIVMSIMYSFVNDIFERIAVNV